MRFKKTMFEIWGMSSPTNPGPKTTYFRRLRHLTATLTAYIFGMKQDIDNQASALEARRGLIYCVKISNFSPQTA